MRRLEVLDDLYLKFPGRTAEFDLGVEIGALSVLMAQGESMLCRRLTVEGVEQLRPIAERFGYSVIATPADEGMVETSLIHRRFGRPKLRVV
jgi:hypothetical protein